MTIEPACVACIINQSRRVADAIGADRELSERMVGRVEAMSQHFGWHQNPPEVAAGVYAELAKLAGKHDLYDEVKAHSTQTARELMEPLRERIAGASEPLLTVTKVAVAGNVIDLAAEFHFDLHEELERLFDTPFAHDDFEPLAARLAEARTLLYIGDNAGEHLFDYLYIETLRKLFPELAITYMVRGCPIINDVTLQEAREAGFETLCTLMDSGVDTPGFVYGRANAEARAAFDGADLILAKGMGNYECLTPARREGICCLLKVKCQVVANALGREVGDLVCKFL